MKGQVFWMFDPEADAIQSPFVRQPHYNDLEQRIRELEAEIAQLREKLAFWEDKTLAAMGVGPK